MGEFALPENLMLGVIGALVYAVLREPFALITNRSSRHQNGQLIERVDRVIRVLESLSRNQTHWLDAIDYLLVASEKIARSQGIELEARPRLRIETDVSS